MPVIPRSNLSQSRARFLNPKYSPVKALPMELWHHIVKFAADEVESRSLARCLSAVSPGLRNFFLHLAFPSLTLHGDQAYILKDLCNGGLQTVSAFAFTKTLVVAAHAEDIASSCAAAAQAAHNLASLSAICPDVHHIRSSRTLQCISASFQHFAPLARRPHLRHFGLYLQIPTRFSKTDCLDLSELDFVTSLVQLHSLTLRVSGGLSFAVDEPILLPPSLTRLHVTPAVLGLIHRASWSQAQDLLVVHIEDTRKRSQLKGSSESLAAAALTSALAPALPAWTLRLRDCRLFAVIIDYTAIVLVGELSSLECFDFQPKSIAIAPEEIALLERKAIRRSSTIANQPAPDADTASRLAEFAGPLPALAELLPLLKYLLGRFPKLHVLRLGHRSPRLRGLLVSSQDSQPEHLFLRTALLPYLLPSLSLWSFAIDDGTEPVHHLPTCGLCSDLSPGTRSPTCSHLHFATLLSNRQADHPDQIHITHIPQILQVHNRLTTVGPLF
ncbi:hypothetical protein AURDEDRAFT_177630 [Auricularia subglabra TFB-10046 SS5]|uniref:Uncharacterized protein n=1 Tax=Auricularia subglabra (strain TFB-10046 / SS5) TaxID=717982 RepID=J0CSM8_AURST|nr:hypothetical protein AURDEDRAFT_177630 [Auricularia subglabra TFB-10046 SS5]